MWGVFLIFYCKHRDFRNSTYGKTDSFSPYELNSYLSSIPIHLLLPHAKEIKELTDLYLGHHFNLLGSNWIHAKHGITTRGLEGWQYDSGPPILSGKDGKWLRGRINSGNLKRSQSIWALIDHDYIPIDWQLDLKSGFRWSENTWYLDIHYGHLPGVDIKIPWELGRMQHLPIFGFAYALAAYGEKDFRSPQIYLREFRNQVLDFIATNPPRFGVNWRSTMDVAIRSVNWLITYDIFKACGAEFDEDFKKEFYLSIYQHGKHIIENLEWNNDLRGNHYLSNIVGLIFVAAYLPCMPESNVWLAFAVQELVEEVKIQFNPDGTNFEASTCYHRLSAEMVAYGTALVLGLSEKKKKALLHYDHNLHKRYSNLKAPPIPFYSLKGSAQNTPFPPWYIERLEKMAEFTMHITKPDGHIPQIGDNDSGRFIKLKPLLYPLETVEVENLTQKIKTPDDSPNLDEDHLDHRHLIAAINGLFERKDFAEFIGLEWIETSIIKQLAHGIRLPSYKNEEEPTAAEGRYEIVDQSPQNLKLYSYSDFGLYIFRSRDVYLAIRCGSIGQNGNGGHAHNDNLSFELNIKGKDFIVDGGSYLYTSSPEIRNMFRSTRAHNTLAVEGYEQNRWEKGLEGLFWMRNDAQAHLLILSQLCLKGEHNAYGKRYYRQFSWKGRFLSIEDIFDSTLPNVINLNLSPNAKISRIREIGVEKYHLQLLNESISLEIYLKGFKKVDIAEGFYSPVYGRRMKNQMISCHRSGQTSLIEIDTGLRELNNDQ